MVIGTCLCGEFLFLYFPGERLGRMVGKLAVSEGGDNYGSVGHGDEFSGETFGGRERRIVGRKF